MSRFPITMFCVLVMAACHPHLRASGEEAATFDSASQQATAEVDTLRALWSESAALREKIAVESDPNAKAELQKQLDNAIQSVADSKKRILTHVDAALKLADANVEVERVNQMRYLRCFVNYDDGEYVAAGAQGEFVALTYPADKAALPCARIALASYIHLYRAKSGLERDAAKAKIVVIANHIVATWPNDPAAAEARPFLAALQ